MNHFEMTESPERDMENGEQEGFLEKSFGFHEVETAPPMEIQVQEISEAFLEFPELQYDNWRELEPEERIDVLQQLEAEVARIEHRDMIPIRMEDLGDHIYGRYSPQTNDITINRSLLESGTREDYLEAMDTYFHEGRHAYQYYNLMKEQVEPNSQLCESWDINLNVLGYNSGDYGLFGYEEYYTQPIEVDARVFAEAAMTKLDLR